jgi:serine/threonine protein kinase/Flp pilus assembly protein TadD
MTNPLEREIAVFSAARRLSARERAAHLDEACAGDAALRQRVEQLLASSEEVGAFLQEPAPGAPRRADGIASAKTLQDALPAGEKAGDRIGRYKLLQQIGEGGCGVVYMAEQEEPVRRRVALKVIKLGMDTKNVVARFEAERQALALMDHPNIAKVLDAGATETGRPFFVMELVRGIKITDFCDDNNLSTEERLDLFIQVCQAVQHAHQKGIIHRDLKPSNILVTISEPGAPGCPKVIDFGIAKATAGQCLTDKTVFTAFEQFIGTPAYMSPEQAMMTALDIDTRTDIYSLGVLLYELLTGKTPLDQKELLAAGLDEMRRTIREKEPIRPSTRLSTMLEGELTTTAKHRHTEAPKLIHQLRGDLDWIVMKALEKDRGRRYETANGLARDVQRYLADEPVVARPPSGLYRFQKLARRNKLAFAATCAVAAALIIGLAASMWEYLKERKARQQAVAAEGQAQAINKFLTEDLLFQATPERNAREKKVTMEEVLAVATSNLDHNAEIARQPELEATLRLDLGMTYHALGGSAEADRNLRQAFELRRRELGPTNMATLEAEFCLADYLQDLAHDYVQAGTLLLHTWRVWQKTLGQEHWNTLGALEAYEITLYQTAHFTEAEQIARYILSIRERTLGLDHPATITALQNLAACVGLRGDHAQAEALSREIIRRCDRSGANRKARFIQVKELASHRTMQGDPAEANKRMTEAIPLAAREFGPTHPYTLHMQRVLARALAEEGCFVEAEALARQTLEERLRQAIDPEGNGRTMLILGRALMQQGRMDEAEDLFQAALPLLREYIRTKDAGAVLAENWLGAIQVARGAYSQAEKLMLPDSDRFFDPANQLSPTEVRLAVGNIITLYEAWGKPERAANWQKKLNGLVPIASSQ